MAGPAHLSLLTSHSPFTVESAPPLRTASGLVSSLKFSGFVSVELVS